VALQESPVWRRACKYAQVKTAGEIPKQAQAATRAQILEVCRGAPKKTAALIALVWITTGRPGCISQLRAEDLTRTENGLAVTFRRGKTVKLRKRPYTVTTAPGEFAPFLEALANETGFLFPCETLQLRKELLKEMTEALRPAVGEQVDQKGSPATHGDKGCSRDRADEFQRSWISVNAEGVPGTRSTSRGRSREAAPGSPTSSGGRRDPFGGFSLKPPSSAALGLNRRGRWKLHCKNVGQFSMMALLDLPSKDPTIKEAMTKLNEWLTRPEKYAKVPLPTEILTARLPKAHINLMEKHGKAERSPAGSVEKSTYKVFTTAEPAKERERLIEHPIDINDATIGDLEKTTFLPQEERHNALLLGDDTVTVDADCAAWFDQAGLAQEVRDFFTFMWKGQAWRLKVLPMGMRHSVAIAHTATRQLLNFDWGSVWVEPYVDNIRFSGCALYGRSVLGPHWRRPTVATGRPRLSSHSLPQCARLFRARQAHVDCSRNALSQLGLACSWGDTLYRRRSTADSLHSGRPFAYLLLLFLSPRQPSQRWSGLDATEGTCNRPRWPVRLQRIPR
jgi:hypothetical protein